MRKLSIILLLALIFQNLAGQTEKAFPHFTWIDADAVQQNGSRFGYEKESFTLIFKACDKLPVTDACYDANNDNNDYTLLGRYKNSIMSEYVNILYSPGPSADPQFIISDKNNQLIWSEFSEELCVNSNGIIYLSGNLNKMFNQRKKLQFSNGKVREVKQPYYYVDVRGKLLKPIKLYSQKENRGELIATLPIGYEIEVLLADANVQMSEYGYEEEITNYLVRTAFGLVGWLKLSESDTYFMDPVVKGLGYLGD